MIFLGTIDERVTALYNSLGSDVDENIELCYQLIKEVNTSYMFFFQLNLNISEYINILLVFYFSFVKVSYLHT